MPRVPRRQIDAFRLPCAVNSGCRLRHRHHRFGRRNAVDKRARRLCLGLAGEIALRESFYARSSLATAARGFRAALEFSRFVRDNRIVGSRFSSPSVSSRLGESWTVGFSAAPRTGPLGPGRAARRARGKLALTREGRESSRKNASPS